MLSTICFFFSSSIFFVNSISSICFSALSNSVLSYLLNNINLSYVWKNSFTFFDANSVPNNEYSNYKLVLNGYIGKRPTDPDKPAPTVTARGDRKGGVVVLPHPNGKRRMSIRELATIQSFPINFHFIGSRTDCYRQIGNAVPILLANAIAKAVRENLNGACKKNE